MHAAEGSQPSPSAIRGPDLAARRLAAHALLALLVAPAAAHALDGYYVPDWASGGRTLVDVGPRDDYASTILIQPDGKLLLGGHCGMDSTRYTLCAARLRADGQIDFGFGPDETGRILLNTVPDLASFNSTLGLHGLALQGDGRAILGGRWACGNWSGCAAGLLVRLSARGIAEPNPNAQYGVQYAYNAQYAFNTVDAVLVAPDGKIIVAGCTVRAGSNPPNYDFGIARFNADLSPDTTFGTDGRRVGAFDLGGDYYDCATSLALQADRKIIAAGVARGGDGRLKAALLRLNADGSADASFGNNGRAWFDHLQASPGNIAINAIAIDRYGRIDVAGVRQIWDGQDEDFFVARLDPSGVLDPGFGSAGVASIAFDLAAPYKDVASDLRVQGDGKILLAGHASASGPTSVFALARVHDDGSLDTSFGISGKSTGTFAPPAQATNQQDLARTIALGNGGLYVAGPGRAAGGDLRFGVAKLQLDAIFADGFER